MIVLGKPGFSDMDEFSENFRTAFETCTNSWLSLCNQLVLGLGGTLVRVQNPSNLIKPGFMIDNAINIDQLPLER